MNSNCISLVGALSDGNFGDDWQLSIFCRNIIARYPECKIQIRSESVFAKNLERSFPQQVKAISPKWFLSRQTQILVGGEIFFSTSQIGSSPITRYKKLLEKYLGFGSKLWGIVRYKFANTNIFAKSTLAFGIGFGDLSEDSIFRKKRIGYELRNLVYLLFRDPHSQKNFLKLGYSPSVISRVSVDLSFLDIVTSHKQPANLTICVVLRTTTSNSKVDVLNLALRFKKISSLLGIPLKIMLCQRDLELESLLREHRLICHVYDQMNLEEFMSEMSLSTHIFSMRLHPIYFGAARGRNVYSLGFDEKFRKSLGPRLFNFSIFEFDSMTLQDFNKILASSVIFSASEVQNLQSQLSIEFDSFVQFLKKSEIVK